MLSLQETRKSPEHKNHGTHDYGFDPQVDFSKFLEEAKNHASTGEGNHVQATISCTEADKKNKKSWKTSLFSWFRAEKNKNMSSKERGNVHASKPRKDHVSGPIYGSYMGFDVRLQRQTSGPTGSMMNLNHARKRAEDEIPYMSLDQISNPHHLKSYGPVYLVT